MRAFSVVIPFGQYDETYQKRQYFFSKEKAENFINEYNAKLEIDSLPSKTCNECNFNSFSSYKYEDFVSISMLPNCFSADRIDYNFTIICKNRKCRKDIYPAELEEIEIEE